MTAATQAPARQAPRATGAAALSAWRLLRIELRRSPMPLILPLIAALFWFDSYRPSASTPPMWVYRTFWNMGQGHTIIDFGPLVAGMAAWIGSRDGRHGTADLVTAACRPRWPVQVITWAAAAIWAVAGYLAFTGAMFAVYAAQGVVGTPPWWWVGVGATAVLAFSAAGFAVGAFWPGRFAAPVAAFGGFLAMMLSSQGGFSLTSGWALILPTNSNGNFQPDSGLLYPWLPDLPIARIMLLAGLGIAILGVLGLPAAAGRPALRRAAAVVTLCGVAAACTAVGLAGTARLGAHGIVIPALHDAANDRPFPYTPVCSHSAAIPVCLSPDYRSGLAGVTAALAPVVSEVAGLPGAPVRATQVGATYSSGEGERGQAMTITGQPPVLDMPLGADGPAGTFSWTTSQAADQLRLLFVHAFVGAGNGAGTPAQQAVQAALLQGAGIRLAQQPKLSSVGLPGWAQTSLHELSRGQAVGGGSTEGVNAARATSPIYAAARRLAGLPSAARHAWLAVHLAALRSGRLTLKDLP